MQISKLFTVYDQKAEVYLPPFFVPTKGLATRAFTDCINSAEHQFGKHPQDYTLFYLGEFSDEDASFDLIVPQSLGNGVEFLNTDEPERPGEHENVAPKPSIQSDQNSGDPA